MSVLQVTTDDNILFVNGVVTKITQHNGFVLIVAIAHYANLARCAVPLRHALDTIQSGRKRADTHNVIRLGAPTADQRRHCAATDNAQRFCATTEHTRMMQ